MANRNEFVWKQLKMCECKEYFDLFKDFNEDKFRQLNISALNKLPIDDAAKDKIYEQVCQLKFQQKINSAAAAAGEATSSSSSSVAASVAITGSDQIIKGEVGGANDNLQYEITDDDDIEITFCNTTTPQINQRQEEIVTVTTNTANEILHDASASGGDSNECQVSTSAGRRDSLTGASGGDDGLDETSAGMQNQCDNSTDGGGMQMPTSTTSSASVETTNHESKRLFWENFAQTIKSYIFNELAASDRARGGGIGRNWKPERNRNILGQFMVTHVHELTITSSSTLNLEIDISDFIPLMTMGQLDEFKSYYKNAGMGLVKLSELLRFIFIVVSGLRKLNLHFNTTQDLNLILDSLAGIPCEFLTCVKIVSTADEAVITQVQITKLANNIVGKYSSLTQLIIDSVIQIDDICNNKSFDLLFLRLADKLKHFEMVKYFIGRSNSTGKLFEIKIPLMPEIESIIITPEYEISVPDLTTNNEHVIELDGDNNDAEGNTGNGDLLPISVLLTFQNDEEEEYAKMKCIKLGSLIEIDIKLTNLPALEIFYVGSPWNIRTAFSNTNGGWINKNLQEIQFPDGLTDPTIFQRVRTTFPSITKVKLQLPTVECLKVFFSTFAKSRIKSLEITFDYVFECGLISALTGKPFVTSSNDDYEKLVKLKQCLHWEDFVRKNNIEMPDEDEDEEDEEEEEEEEEEDAEPEPGIRNLRFLNTLKLTYISRKLFYPKSTTEEQEETAFLSDELFPQGQDFYDAVSNNRYLLSSRRLFTKGCFVKDVKAQHEFIKRHKWHLLSTGNKRTFTKQAQVNDSNQSGSSIPTGPKKSKTHSNKISPAFLHSRVTRIKKERAK